MAKKKFEQNNQDSNTNRNDHFGDRSEDLANLDWIEILKHISAFATCELTRDELMRLSPLSQQVEAEKQIEEILSLVPIVKLGQRPHMESLDLYSSWIQRLRRQAVLKSLELKDVRHFCLETIAFQEIISSVESNHQRSLVEVWLKDLMKIDEPLSAIDQILTPAGEIRLDASERLFQLNSEKTVLARQVMATLDRLVKGYKIEHLLQDKYVTTRDGRWVLPIKSGMQHGFEGIIHDSSQTKQTVFMEPQEIVPFNNRLREIEVDIENEIERLLIDLSNYLSGLREDFEKTKDILFRADIRLAQAQWSVQVGAVDFSFSSDFSVIDVRHPLLVFSGSKDIVPNSVQLTPEQRILLLSGPNAGGKTVLLKSIGLAAQMARCGLPICAGRGTRIPFFKKLLITLGDSQSVDAHLSTFAAHLKSLNKAAAQSGPDTLLLIDEICGSTDPEEGAALARGFIESYSEHKVFAVITSHLSQLKLAWDAHSGVINGSLEFDASRGPTYRFIMGIPGQSLAIQTASRVGVDKKIIDKALKHLSPDIRRYQESLQEMENLKTQLIDRENELRNSNNEMQKEKEKYQLLIQQFESEKSEQLSRFLRQQEKQLESMIQEAKVTDVFSRHEKLQKIQYELPTLVKRDPARQSRQVFSDVNEFMQAYPPGSAVYVTSLNREGLVQGRANAKNEIPILSESMRFLVDFKQLQPSRRPGNPTQSLVRRAGGHVFSPAENDRVVDLRGFSSEEALSQLEMQLDAASLASEDRVKIIHGHGTDTLKRTIRSYLSRSVYVKKWQAGSPETGGDGVTWVEIK